MSEERRTPAQYRLYVWGIAAVSFAVGAIAVKVVEWLQG
jgi:hypothetical protein